MNNINEYFKISDKPIFKGKILNLPASVPLETERNVVFRPRDTIFHYTAWPSVCCDEEGTLYAVSAWGTDHVCPFTKYCMYISKNGGKTWSPPIVVQDSYIGDGHGGIAYLGNGRLVLTWAYHPGDVLYYDYFNWINGAIWGRSPDGLNKLRLAMLDIYPDLPPEKLVGGSFVKISDDYGITWSDPIRVPIASPHGPALCQDGTLIYLGKEFYPSTQGTFEAFGEGQHQRVYDCRVSEFRKQMETSRCGRECTATAIYAYASTDGGVTWEKRGICQKPADISWNCCQEPDVTQLSDGSLLGAIRVENEMDTEMVVYTTRSFDGGMTWSEWKCTHVNGGPPHLMQHSSGAVILTVGRRVGEALGEFALISHDGGETWTEEYSLDDTSPNGDLGYPCTTELPNGDLVTVYYQPYVDTEKGIADQKPCIQCVRWKL